MAKEGFSVIIRAHLVLLKSESFFLDFPFSSLIKRQLYFS